MKRIVIISALMLFSAFMLVAEDQTYALSNVPGTYSTLAKSNQVLRWTLSVDASGDVFIILKEEGQEKRLTGLYSSTDTYSVKVVMGNVTKNYTGKIMKNNNVYNAILFNVGADLAKFISESLQVTITGHNTEYKLGTFSLHGADSLLPVNTGEAGIMFYDKGYYSDGWRYLEVSSADVRVVDGIPTIDKRTKGYDKADAGYIFGFYRDTPDGSNLYVNGTRVYSERNCTGSSLGDGFYNTELIVRAQGDEAYSDYSGDSGTWFYAAKICDDLIYRAADGTVYDDWFLPSKDELNLIYEVLASKGLGNFDEAWYWSSTENSNYSGSAWLQQFQTGNQYLSNRSYTNRVRAVRAF